MLLIYILGSLFLGCYPILAQQEGPSMCLDSNFDMNRHVHNWVPCPRQKVDTSKAYLRFLKTNTPPPPTTTTSSAFDIKFQCFHVPENICQKAKRAFQNAGKVISDVLLFKEPVRVNATLMSFCKMNNECDRGMMTLGGSSPARAIPLLNDDGLVRLHPQALVKQLGLSDHPSFAPFDILSVFNADAPYWFEEDGLPIQPHQADFSFVILHEFMHGLGFYSGWNQYISTNALTPDPSPLLANQLISLVTPMSTALHSTQFLESAMDRLMSILLSDDPIPVSDITKQLNKIQVSSLDQLTASPSFKPANEMAFFATSPNSLGLRISVEKKPIVLETGLRPFQPGSSISHVDYKTYTMTPDFLMRFMQDRGVTLQDAIKRGGGSSPIGPLLLGVLEEIGYSTVNKPNNIPHLSLFRQEREEASISSFHHGPNAVESSSSTRLFVSKSLISLCILLLSFVLINY